MTKWKPPWKTMVNHGQKKLLDRMRSSVEHSNSARVTCVTWRHLRLFGVSALVTWLNVCLQRAPPLDVMVPSGND